MTCFRELELELPIPIELFRWNSSVRSALARAFQADAIFCGFQRHNIPRLYSFGIFEGRLQYKKAGFN